MALVLVMGLTAAAPAGVADAAGALGPITRDPSAPVRVVVQKTVRTDAVSSTLDDIFKWLQLLAAGTAVIGLYFIRAQLRAARAAARSQRTAEFSERWHAREFLMVMSPVLAYLDAVDARECVEKIRAWEMASHAEDPCLPRGPSGLYPQADPRASKNDVLYVIGFVESLALLYNHEELDRELVAESFGLILMDLLTKSRWFVDYYRQVKSNGLFGYEWERMALNLRKGCARSPWRRAPSDPHPIYAELEAANATGVVGAFYLPSRRGRASGREWQRCAELSLAHDKGGVGAGGPREEEWLVVTVH